MGYMSLNIFDPFPPTNDPPQYPILTRCSDGPMCPSGGMSDIWTKPAKCPVNADKKLITYGGAANKGSLGGPCKDPIPEDTLSATAKFQGATGVDLDLEGCMNCPSGWQGTATNAKAQNLTVQITPLASAAKPGKDPGSFKDPLVPWLKNNPRLWDTVAPMFYDDGMVDPSNGFNVCCCGDKAPTAANPCGKTYTWIKQWLDSGIPKEKLFLTVDVKGLEPYMVNFFADIVVTHNLAGISYWQAALAKGKGLLPNYTNVAPGTPCPKTAQRCP